MELPKIHEPGEVGVPEVVQTTQFQVLVSGETPISRDLIYAHFDGRRDADKLLKRQVTTMFTDGDKKLKLTFEGFTDADALVVENIVRQIAGLRSVDTITKL